MKALALSGLQALGQSAEGPDKPAEMPDAWKGATSNADATQPTQAPVVVRPRGPVEGILARFGDVSRAGEGGGGLFGGVARTAAATSEREATELKDKQLLATSNAQMLHQQALTHKLNEEQIDAGVASGKEGLNAIMSAEAPGQLLAEGKTSDELNTMIQKGELNPAKQTVFQTGRVQVGRDSNGQPLYRSTYSVVQPAGDVKMSKKQADYVNAQTNQDFQEGQVLPALQFNHLWQQAQNAETTKAARDLALAKNNIEVHKANVSTEADAIGRNPIVMNAINGHMTSPDDPYALVKAYNAIMNDPKLLNNPNMPKNFSEVFANWAGHGDPAAFGKMQEKFAEAQNKNANAIDDMLNKASADPKEIEGHTPAFEAAMNAIIRDPNAGADKKKKAADVLAVVQDVRARELQLKKDEAAGKKEGTTGFQGNEDATSPEEFFNSLEKSEQTLVKEMGTGKMPITRLEYLAARKPEILEAVARSFPGFDASKVKAYTDIYKDFTSGKTAVALNSGGTALKHLKELQDLNTVASHIPHTPPWTSYQNKVDTVATELARFYGDSTVPAIAAIKETLASTLPGNREAAITTQSKSMGDKLDAYENQWIKAAPSKEYEAPLPGISAAARAARAALDPDYAQRLKDDVPAGSVTPKNAPKGSFQRPADLPPDTSGAAPDPKTGKMYWHNAAGKVYREVKPGELPNE
jgi:hypothetical protein